MFQQNSNGNTSQWRKSFVLLSVAASVFAVFAALTFRLCKPLQLSNDCALYLHCGQELLRGAIPYRDLWDTNPPLIMYLSTLPIMYSLVAGLHPIVGFVWVIFAVTVCSLLAISYMVLCLVDSENDRSTSAAFVLAFGLSSLYLSISWLFGQREHIFVLCYMPLLFLRFLRHRGTQIPVWFACSIGLLAGVGISLKPYFLVMLAVPELAYGWSSIRKNLFKPELVAAVLAIAGFALHFAFVPPDARENFFGLVVPLMVDGYKAFDANLMKVATACTQWPWLIATLGMSLVVRKKTPLIPALALYTIASYALVLYQHKGFPYHPIPEVVGVILLGCVEFAVLAEMLMPRLAKVAQPVAVLVPASVAIGCLAVMTLNLYKITTSRVVFENTLAQISTPAGLMILQKTAPNDSIVCADLGWTLQYPLLLQTGRRVGTRFYTFFNFGICEYLKASSDHRKFSVERLNQLENQFAEQVAQDIARNRPRLIFLKSDRCWPMGDDFNLYKILVSFQSVKEELKRNYDPKGTFEGYTVFERSTQSAEEHIHAKTESLAAKSISE